MLAVFYDLQSLESFNENCVHLNSMMSEKFDASGIFNSDKLKIPLVNSDKKSFLKYLMQKSEST